MTSCNCAGCELKDLFFTNVSSDEIESMCTRKTEQDYQKGEVIINEGEEIKEFVYLKKGLVKLYRKGVNDTEQIICFAQPLDFVSLLSIFSQTHYKYSVAALEDSVTCNISLEEIKNIANNNGRFAMTIMEKMNKATDHIIIDFLDLKQKRLYGRIAYILLFFAENIYKSNIFELPVSRKEIAEYIGMTVENVIRTLSDLRKDGIIKINGKTIEVTDINKLKKISELS